LVVYEDQEHAEVNVPDMHKGYVVVKDAEVSPSKK
jgi:hypothetical protein